jgi:hypothetical protein
MQLGHLIPKFGVLPHHGFLWEVLRPVRVILSKGEVADGGVHVCQHVVQDCYLCVAVFLKKLMIFGHLGIDRGDA